MRTDNYYQRVLNSINKYYAISISNLTVDATKLKFYIARLKLILETES